MKCLENRTCPSPNPELRVLTGFCSKSPINFEFLTGSNRYVYQISILLDLLNSKSKLGINTYASVDSGADNIKFTVELNKSKKPI